MKTSSKSADNVICRNRKATYRFEVLEKLECGIALHGTEVKSLRDKQASLNEAYAVIEGNELWIVKFHISAYRFSQAQIYEPTRRRKLLLHARQIRKLRPKVEQKGLTLVPLQVYFNSRGLAKVTLGLARGKRIADKREAIRLRDYQREMGRAVRSSPAAGSRLRGRRRGG